MIVPIKTKQQQTALMLHRTRQLLVRQRTMLSNALRPGRTRRGVGQRGRNGTGELLRIIADADDHRIPRPPAAFSISWRGSTSRSEPRSDPSTRAFWPGIARARRAGGWRRSRASARLSPRLWLPRLATGRHLHRGATSPPGSGWCRSNIRPVARTGSAVSPSRAIDTCDGCWLSARWPSSAMHRSMGPRPAVARTIDGAPTDQGGRGGARQQDRTDGLGHHGSRRQIQGAKAVDGGMTDARRWIGNTNWRGHDDVMQIRSFLGDRENPFGSTHSQMRVFDWDPFRAEH